LLRVLEAERNVEPWGLIFNLWQRLPGPSLRISSLPRFDRSATWAFISFDELARAREHPLKGGIVECSDFSNAL